MSAAGIGAASVAAILALAGCAGAFATGYFAMRIRLALRERSRRRSEALDDLRPERSRRHGTGHFGLAYMENLTMRLFAGQTVPLAPSVRQGRAGQTRAGRLFDERAGVAGVSARISCAAFCEARMRLALAAALAGMLIGVVFSTEMGLVLGLAGALAGRALPRRALDAACAERRADAERHLSEMLEVVALGLRSGLTFDRSFALYGEHFECGFAQSCALACRRWALGLTTREEALRELAASYECDQLVRVVETIVRGLRFGSSLTGSLSEAAVQARETYRAALAERVAKAPVKMMLPTGTLILPAMLLLVMGPILLELAGGF